jgi:hypothetical protein
MPVSLAGSSSSAMHGALVPIAYKTASGSVSDISFINLPQTYQDLMLVISVRGAASQTSQSFAAYVGTGANGTNLLQSNENSVTRLSGDGSSASSNRSTNTSGMFLNNIPGATSTSGVFATYVIHFLNYANSTTFKTLLSRYAGDLNGSGVTSLVAGLARTTSPLLTVGVATYGDGNFASGTTLSLYGVRRVGQ